MKHVILILFSCSFFFQKAYCQNAYYDALKLSVYVKDGKFIIPADTSDSLAKAQMENYFIIINSYYNNKFRTPKEMHDNLADYDPENPNPDYNPFIANYLSPGSVQSFSIDEAKFISNRLISSIGGVNITQFADGLAKFLVERAKEELNVAFFERLKELSEKYPESKIMFPNTQKLLVNFESWNYANIINTLREAFDKDLKNLLYNITQLSKLDVLACGTDNICISRINNLKTILSTDDGRIFLSAVLVGNGLINNQKIPDIFNEISGTNYLGGLASLTPNAKNSFQLLNIINLSLKSYDSDKHYISAADFAALMRNPIPKNIFLGLIFQQIKSKNIQFSAVNNIDTDPAIFINGLKKYTEPILSQSEALKTSYVNLATAKNNGEQDLLKYWAAIFQSSEALLIVVQDIHKIDPSLVFSPTLNNVFSYSRNTLAIAHDISVRNYSAAVVSTLTFMMERLPQDNDTKNSIKAFVKYGSFAANVVQAKNPDDVKEAIKAVALPAGSASIKKNTEFNVALNGYLGAFVGEEFLKESPGKKWSKITGIYAPIGITLSHGLGKCGSISAFGSLIDIGAFASFRLQDDTTKTLPKVALQNIFAPGVGLIYGIPRIPLSFGWSWQYGPTLREIKATNINASERANHRWQFFLAVDIPIVNFYSSPSKFEI